MEGLINKMKNIHRDPSLSPRGLAPGTAKKTSSKRHIPGGLLPGHGRMRSGHQSLGGIAASPASLINKRFALPFLALLAVLTAGLLFLLPGGLLQAQDDGDARIEYAENGTDPVATYTGLDPEEPHGLLVAAGCHRERRRSDRGRQHCSRRSRHRRPRGLHHQQRRCIELQATPRLREAGGCHATS